GFVRPKDPLASLEVREGENKYKPFYASFSSTGSTNPEPARASRYLLFVMDVSGSMMESAAGGTGTKYDAAKAAAQELLTSFGPGDNIAIVPFDSRDVKL